MTSEKIKLNPIDENSYCPELWSRAYISQQNNQFAFKPCCYFRPDSSPLIKDFKKVHWTINETHAALRQDSLNGIKHAGCGYCYNFESSDNLSARQLAIQKYGNEVTLISHLDLNLGNLCNLSCAICGPFNSSNWVPLYEQGWSEVSAELKYKPKNRETIDDPDLFQNLKTIQLQGGEVFLEPNYTLFFENMGKYRSYDDLQIMIFTNGTARPSERFLEILNRCGTVNIFFSIDDIEQRFEYQRRGARWNDVVANIHWFENNTNDNIHLGFNSTYSMFNIYYLKELYEFLSTEFPGFNRNYGAFNSGLGNCSAEYLSVLQRQLVLEKTAGISELSFLKTYIKYKSNPYKDFIDYVNKYDSLTNTSYAQTHPEFWALINN